MNKYLHHAYPIISICLSTLLFAISFYILGCGGSPKYKILSSGNIVDLTQNELITMYEHNQITDSTMVWRGNKWIPLGEDLALRDVLANSRDLAAAFSTPMFHVTVWDCSGCAKFLQGHFNEFPEAPLSNFNNKPAQLFAVSGRKFSIDRDGRKWTGFRFKAPAHIGGPFCWAFLNPIPRSDSTREWTLHEYIVPEHGEMMGFRTLRWHSIKSYPKLAAQFSSAKDVAFQSLDASSFSPGASYLIWFTIDYEPEHLSVYPEIRAVIGFASEPVSNAEDVVILE